MVPPSQMYAAAANLFHGCHVMWALGVPSNMSCRHLLAKPSPGNRGVVGRWSGRLYRWMYARHFSRYGLSGTVTHSALTFWSQNKGIVEWQCRPR